MAVHRAEGESSGRAVVILPGGGYEAVSIVAEGKLIAEGLASRGITAAVLKYRLPLPEASDRPHLVPLEDARRAIALLRSSAETYGFDPAKVGVLGFSAGGHLAATVSVLTPESPAERPDFSVLVYPVTTLAAKNQQWLEESLFHRPMTVEEKRRYALVDNIGPDTPPAFLVHAWDDDVVPIAESQRYASALVAAGGTAEVHFFPTGGHGFGPGRAGDGTDQWLALAANWIHRQ
jgi:acetyl esterase/lipase